jgi:gamma-butyrobetaine dioxygenase
MDSHQSRFHYVWLRNSEAFSDTLVTKPVSDRHRLPDDPLKLHIESIKNSESEIIIYWGQNLSDSCYSTRWLRDNCYSDSARKSRRHRPSLWNAAEALKMPRFDWQAIQSGDHDLQFKLYMAVRDYGIARVTNVSVKEDSVADVASHFGPVLTSHLGKVFDVKPQPDFNIGATQTH